MISFLKSFIKKTLSVTPYEVRRRRPEKFLPDATLENIQLLLAHYAHCQPMACFVQIGACDGISGDAVYRFLQKGTIRALVVEPVEQPFQQLCKAYQGVSNVTTACLAIGRQDGEIAMFKVKEGSQSIPSYWSRQLASFDRQHLLLHGVPDQEIERIRVPCLTLKSLLEKHHFERVDVLQIDTEGFDADIVEMALELANPPDCINFENVHLDNQRKQALFSKLQACGYLWAHDQWNTLAVHERLIKRWTSPNNASELALAVQGA